MYIGLRNLFSKDLNTVFSFNSNIELEQKGKFLNFLGRGIQCIVILTFFIIVSMLMIKNMNILIEYKIS